MFTCRKCGGTQGIGEPDKGHWICELCCLEAEKQPAPFIDENGLKAIENDVFALATEKRLLAEVRRLQEKLEIYERDPGGLAVPLKPPPLGTWGLFKA